MSNVVETIENALTTIRIEHDEDCQNPYTDYDMFGTLCHWHKRGFIGADYSRRQDELQALVKQMVKAGGIAISVYLYEHSGQTISAAPFSCPWDSGTVGIWRATKEEIAGEFGGDKDKARKCIEGQIKTLDSYLRGECYGYTIEDKEGNHLDSCWGFLGDIDYCRQEAISAAKAMEKDLETTCVSI